MSSLSSAHVRIRLKLGGAEVEIEAPLADLNETIGLLPQMAKYLPKSVQVEMETSRTDAEVLFKDQIPEIKIDKQDSLTDVISKIFSHSWGRTPRKLSHVREVLESYGLLHPKQSVAVSLLRLAQSGKLRRFKGKDDEFVYTASIRA